MTPANAPREASTIDSEARVRPAGQRTRLDEVPAPVDAICARLPARIVRLINPDVLAARAQVIRRKSHDLTSERVGRRRCAEIIANHLLQTTTHAA